MSHIFSYYILSFSNCLQSCSHFVQFWPRTDLLTSAGRKASCWKSRFHEGRTGGPEGRLESLCVSSSLPVIRSVALSSKCTFQCLLCDIVIIIPWSISLLERAQHLRVQEGCSPLGSLEAAWILHVGVRISAQLCQRHRYIVLPCSSTLQPPYGMIFPWEPEPL